MSEKKPRAEANEAEQQNPAPAPVAKVKAKVKEPRKEGWFRRTLNWTKRNWKTVLGSAAAGAAATIGTEYVVGKVHANKVQHQAAQNNPLDPNV